MRMAKPFSRKTGRGSKGISWFIAIPPKHIRQDSPHGRKAWV
jgi:hypothetical protein